MLKKDETKIPDEDVVIEQISAKHKDIIKNFQTYEKELKDFLVDDALKNQEMHISNTYLWFHKQTGELLAYISILTDALRIQGTHLRQYFLEKGIEYKSLPSLKIGRLCVDDRYRKRDIGTKTTVFVTKLAVELNKRVACRFIYVDAKRNKHDPKKDAVKFYKRTGFKILKEREKGTIPMYYDITNILKYIEKK